MSIVVHGVVGNTTVGHSLSAGVVLGWVGTWIGWISPVVSFVLMILAGAWYLVTLYETDTVQKWLARRRERKAAKAEKATVS